MMKTRVQLFAVLRDIVGQNEVVISVPPHSTVSSLIDALVQQYSQIAEWRKHIRIAVNQEYVSHDYLLKEGDDVVVIPPVSGG